MICQPFVQEIYSACVHTRLSWQWRFSSKPPLKSSVVGNIATLLTMLASALADTKPQCKEPRCSLWRNRHARQWIAIERIDAVIGAGTGRQEHHRNCQLGLAGKIEQSHPVTIGHLPVEQQEVIVGSAERVDAAGDRLDDVDRIPRPLQRTPDVSRQDTLIFKNQ